MNQGKATRDQIAKLLKIDSDLPDESFLQKVEEAAKQIKNRSALEKVLKLVDRYLKYAK